MEDFSRARLESSRKNEYLLKQLENDTAKQFIDNYVKNGGSINLKLQELAFRYLMHHKGSITTYYDKTNFKKVSSDQIKSIYNLIRANSLNRFINFYESYKRKKNKYDEEYADNAFNDLKKAYYIYRKCNNPIWDGNEERITENEMVNLYNIVMNIACHKQDNKKEEK